MRLIGCHIENFGKLHDLTVDFTEGANIICEENGWGKSTFAAFIRAMFYGLEGERKRSIEENERKRYTPWQGGVFGGQLTFEVDGKQYTATRTFNEQDEFELRDATTNLISNDYSSKLGEELFKVDRESFMRTVFIGQADCETAVTDDVNAKIGNLTENSNDLNSFEAANARLKDILNSLTPTRKTGSISQRKTEITELERKVNVGNGIPDALQNVQEKRQEELQKYNQLKAELDAVQKEQIRVSKLQATLAKKEQWENLKKELKETRKLFPNDVPSIEKVETVYRSCNALEKASERMAIYEMPAHEQQQLSSLRMMKNQKGNKTPLLLIGGGTAVIAGLVVMMAISIEMGMMLAFIGVSVAISGVIYNRKWKEAEQLRHSVYEHLEEKYQKLKRANADFESYRDEILEFFMQYGFEPTQNLHMQLLRIRDDVQIYADAYKKLEIFERETDSSVFNTEVVDIENVSLTELNEKLVTLTDARESSHERISKFNADIEDLQEQYGEWEENQLRLEELKNLQEEEQQKYNHILKVQEYLAKAKESITNRYSAPILESFRTYYEMITSDSTEKFHIDANINITRDEEGKQREANTLSSGYKDLIGICLRVALVDAMYKEECPILIMDDPFTNLDDKKIKQAKKFLEYVAQKYQVIYFTCSDARK